MPTLFDNPDSPQEAQFAVYFSGVHVPATSVTISNAAWEMPQASIQVPSSFLLHRFGHDDRVQVAIFYKDNFYTATSDKDPTFRLIFDGEITSYSRSWSAQGANVQFSAVSHVQIFSEMFINFITNVNELAGSHLDTGSGSGVLMHGSQFPTLFFKKGLDTRSPLIQRPYDFIRNMLSVFTNNGAEGSDGSPAFVRSVPVQKFFDKHRKLVKMAKRFVACPVVEDRLSETGTSFMFPIIEAVGSDSILRALMNRTMMFSNRSSLWQSLYMTFQIMFYDILFLNAPPFVLSDHTGTILGKGDVSMDRVSDDHLLRHAAAGETGQTVKIGGNEVTLYMDQAYVDKATSSSSTSSAVPTWDGSNHALSFPQLGQYITKPQNQFGIPPKCNTIFPSMVKSMVYNENFATQPTRLHVGDIEWIPMAGVGATTQMDVAGNALRTGYPEEINLRMQALKTGHHKQSVYDVLLWPDEYFHGVIMSEEQGPSWLRFLANDLNVVNESINPEDSDRDDTPSAPDQPDDGKFNSDGSYNDRVTRLYSAYAKYRFYQEKYSRRQGSINMSFNPYVVPGLPMLYVDTSHTQEHLLAYVTNVSWNMSVGNMSTSVSYSFGRSVYENEVLLRDKFLFIDESLGSGYASLTQPDDPVHTLVPALNQYAGANEMYRRMFYQGGQGDDDTDNYTGAYQSFMERDVIGGDNVPLTTDGTTVPTSKFQLSLRPEYQLYSDSYEDAMRFVARPICTIDEYIHFINGVSEEEKVELGEVGEGRYMYLRHYIPLDPNAILDGAEEAMHTTGKVKIDICTDVGELAEVRADYEEILDKLHDQIYEQQHPNA